MSDERYSECWDCDSDTFRIIVEGGETIAECTECGSVQNPTELYQRGDPNGKAYYDMGGA